MPKHFTYKKLLDTVAARAWVAGGGAWALASSVTLSDDAMVREATPTTNPGDLASNSWSEDTAAAGRHRKRHLLVPARPEQCQRYREARGGLHGNDGLHGSNRAVARKVYNDTEKVRTNGVGRGIFGVSANF